MESRILREAMTAYQAVYDPELRQQLEEKQAFENWVNSLLEEGHDLSGYTWEDMYETYISEMGQVKTTGQSTAVAYKPTPGAGSAGGSGSDGRRASGRDRNAYQTSSSPGALRVDRPAPKPAPAPRPAATAPRPAATAPKPAPLPRPASTAPSAKPAPTAPAKPPVGSGYKKDTSITDMIGRSQIRQGAPINTGSASSDIRSMAARGTAVGGSTPSPTSKSAPSRPMGSRKPGSIVSGLDMFDLVKGHLLDEGYADTEEAALAIMANMSEEWRESIISGEQLQELSNRKLRAYVKKSEKSHQDLNKKWDQGTASYKDKYKSINRERGQERAFKTLDKRSGK